MITTRTAKKFHRKSWIQEKQLSSNSQSIPFCFFPCPANFEPLFEDFKWNKSNLFTFLIVVDAYTNGKSHMLVKKDSTPSNSLKMNHLPFTQKPCYFLFLFFLHFLNYLNFPLFSSSNNADNNYSLISLFLLSCSHFLYCSHIPSFFILLQIKLSRCIFPFFPSFSLSFWPLISW